MKTSKFDVAKRCPVVNPQTGKAGGIELKRQETGRVVNERLRFGVRYFLLSTLIFVLTPLVATSARAEALSSVQASSELDGGKPRTFVYNALDGKERTSWCTSSDDAAPSLALTFKKAQEISTFGLIVGASKGDVLDPDKRAVKEVKISDGNTVLELTFQKETSLQEVTLDPPLRGEKILISITATRGEGELCLPELSLKSRRGNLTGSTIAKKVRSLSTPARRYLGTWTDNVDAPERTLTLSLDGTYRFRFEPLLEGKAYKSSGKWRGSYKRLTLERGSKKSGMSARIDESTLTLKGKGLDESFAGEYVRVP